MTKQEAENLVDEWFAYRTSGTYAGTRRASFLYVEIIEAMTKDTALTTTGSPKGDPERTP